MTTYYRPDAREVLAMLRDVATEDTHKVLEYAGFEFRAGKPVLYCDGVGGPVVTCRTRGELLAAMGITHTPRGRRAN